MEHARTGYLQDFKRKISSPQQTPPIYFNFNQTSPLGQIPHANAVR